MKEFYDGQLAGMNILIVDDTPQNLDILGHILTKGDLNITVAPNGEKALEVIGKNKPDLILLDVILPGLDGFEVCEKLKQNEATKDIPIIFITALADLENVVKGFQVGGIDFVTKPFREKEVVCRTISQLKLKKTMNELVQSQNDLIKSEKLYRSIVEKVPELIFQLDQNRKIVFANHAFYGLGYESAELTGKPLQELIVSENKEQLMEEIATRNVGPLAPVDIDVEMKVNEDSTLFEEMRTSKILVSSIGIWDVPDEEVYKPGVEKNFLGTLCIGKI